MSDGNDLELHLIFEDGKWGFADEVGNIVIPCTWRDAGDFSEGLALVANDNLDYGYIDKTGKIVFPCQWDEVGSFCEGLAPVRSSKGYGYMDKNGEMVIPYNLDWIDACEFENGVAKIFKDAYKEYFIDKSGNIIDKK